MGRLLMYQLCFFLSSFGRSKRSLKELKEFEENPNTEEEKKKEEA